MKSPLTKLTAAAVMITTVVFVITFFEKTVAPAYALEQTIEANHTIKTIHLRIVEGGQSIENNEFSDCWIKYDDGGLVSNFRCNFYEDGEDRAYAVWNEGVLKIWRPSQNVVIIIRVNDMEKYWEHFAKEYDPKLIFQWLYVSRGNAAAQLQINERSENGSSVYVTATHSIDKTRLELVIDPKTKLVKKLSRYRLGEKEDQLDTQIEILAYNQSIDPSMFELSGIPDDALLIDQVDQLVGLEQGNLTNNEIVVKVVRETLKATIVKDYEKVSRLMEGVPGDTIQEFIEEEFDARLARVTSIGQPVPHERSGYHIYVPCEIEVENDERGKWTVHIVAMTEFINYQEGRRWVMHCPDKDNGSHISTNRTVNARDRVGEKLIVPGERVGDFRLGISKDEVLKRLGKPKMIFLGGERYTLNNLPNRYYMAFGGISFRIDGDIVKEITAHDPLYKFSNGLGVGDSEQKIKQAFGSNFQLEEFETMSFLTYEDEGLMFEIHKNRRTVEEINVTQAKHNQQSDRGSGKDVLNLVRQAAAEGRITYKRTTPEEFKQIAGQPTKERVSTDGEVVEMEYPGVQVKFFGKPNLDTPVAILWIAYDGKNIDIGKDRYQKTVKVPPIQPFDKEQGKNPGLGVRRLHEKGITGRGVRVAILDQKLLVDHQEYAERVRLYEEIDLRVRMEPQMHGAAVASIAVGKTVGVAPEAELYYIAKKGGPRDVTQGIDRILKINEQLPKDNKIRVISISTGWTPSVDSYDDIMAACERAKAAGIFVVSCSLEEVYGFSFHGLGRHPSADPDLFESYEPGLWWAKEFYEGTELRGSDCLLVPMDSRTTASPGGKDKYVFHRKGGWSWSVPYIAGVYALAAQVEPDITPERFWDLAMKTGRTIELEYKGEKRPFGPIIDPVRLIRSISDGVGTSQQATPKNTIVPGVRVGDYTLDMSKDEVLKELGEPEAINSVQIEKDEAIRRGEEKCSLDSLPEHYILSFRDVSFWMDGDSIEVISVHSPLYKLSGGFGVGDSEQKIKQAFGEDFKIEKAFGKDFHCYHAKGLGFEIHEKNQTVAGIVVYQPEDDDREDDSSEQEAESLVIVPGVRVGDYTFDMSKDDVLKRLGKPRNIHFAGENYTLDNLPRRYFMSYSDVSFTIEDDRVTGIGVHSPLYKFTNGLGVGDSEQEIKQAFGHNFELKEFESKNFLDYEDKGIQFEIRNKDETVIEIDVYQTERNQSNMNIPKVHRRDDLGPYEDVSGKDLRASDLRYSEDILDTLEFNQETQWPPPERLPEGFDPQILLQEGMNPGLGVRTLHARGITGAGVHVGLIDQPLLLDHPEYAGKIVSYHALDCGSSKSSMHGPAMASQLVGKQCGTAPGASLHVVAVPSWKTDAGYYARALDRFVTYNENASKEQKIRVVSVSCQPSGEGSVFENQPLWDEVVKRAQAQGILVLDCTWHHGFVSLCWLDPEDRENVEACTPGFRIGEVEVDEGHIHVPSAPRTAAEADEDKPFGYAYDGGGRRSRRPKAKNGYSDTIPYAAGILALGWQIRPDLSPAQMKKLLFESAHIHESGAKIIHPAAFIDLVRSQSGNTLSEGVCKEDSETQTIVPGVGVGDYTLDMSKDEVLSKLGEPEAIHLSEDEIVRRGEEKYNLNDLPSECILCFGDVSFWIDDDSIEAISVRSPLYKLSNGFGVGDKEQKIKRAFGEDFHLREVLGKDFLFYLAKGLAFEIHKKNQTVTEIVVFQTEGDGGDPDVPDSAEATLVRKAAEEGRIAYKLTTPNEFKAIAGQPTREWTESDGELIWMKYPGMRVNFFGKPDVEIPHTLNGISCEGREIAFGRNRPIFPRNVGDLHKLGSFSNIDLSRLDLSQQGDLLDRTSFDSLTIWPPSDRLPPGFDPAKRLEWGKNPGLGVRSLHREGITGKGVGIAIIDQPLLKDHVEYADRIKSYHAIEVEGVDIQMHGPPVCSIAVGKSCGVAPQASLHYYAVPPWKWMENRPWARTVEQIVERNRDLSPSEKVRVISISLGAFSGRDYFDQWKSAVEKAHQNGILVVTCDPYFLRYVTLERLVGTDPDDPNNYYFDSGVNALYVPASNWSIASHRGKDVYTFDTVGGNSWTVPYLAGLAAMAFQIHPEISPDRIVTLFQETATQTKRGRVINPRGFVEAVKRL